MKYRVEFEMKHHSCYECPLSNGSDECNLQDQDYDEVDEQLNKCPLKVCEGIENE